jgi:hypothetical protein
VTWPPLTATTQWLPNGRLAAGVNVKELAGELLCVNAFAVELHVSEKAVEVAVTDSLKLIVIVDVTATFDAPAAGTVLLTVGAASPGDPNVCPWFTAPAELAAAAAHVKSLYPVPVPISRSD